MAIEYRYCPQCATPLVREMRFDQMRPVCPRCGFVHFQDPKVAVIGLVTHRGRVLLVRRAVDPGKGQWSLPGGYMDAGEMPHQALERELQEEVNLEVQVQELLGIYPLIDYTGERVGIVLAFRAHPRGSTQLHQGTDDVDAAGWFGPQELPTALAFQSTRELLREWAQGAPMSHKE